jgi:hypothetical protein
MPNLKLSGKVRRLQGSHLLLPLPCVTSRQLLLLSGQNFHLHAAILVRPMPE